MIPEGWEAHDSFFIDSYVQLLHMILPWFSSNYSVRFWFVHLKWHQRNFVQVLCLMTIHITSKIVLVYFTLLVGHALRHVLFSALNIVVIIYTTFWGVCE